MGKASKINQLEKLEKMYRNGRISDSEYMSMRAEIMNDGHHPQVIVYTKQHKTGCLGWILRMIIGFIVVIVLLTILIGNDAKNNRNQNPTKNNEINLSDASQQNTDEILGEVTKKNKTGCYTPSETVQKVRDEINAYGKTKGWKSEQEIANKLKYVYFEKLLEDTVMAHGVGMSAAQFLQKREEYPDMNKDDRKQKAKCDFIKVTPVHNNSTTESVETKIKRESDDKDIDHLF